VKVADPEVASVPPCAVTRNWEVLTPSLEVRYCFEKKEKRCERECVDPQKKEPTLRKVFKSPLKLVIIVLPVGRKENTLLAPLDPEYKFLHRISVWITISKIDI